MTILEQLNCYRIIPVIEIEKASDARSLGKALMDGGLPFAEITFRTEAASEAIGAMAAAFPAMWVGAGSVLTIFQAQMAIRAGARYIVSPGFDEEIVDWCLEQDVVVGITDVKFLLYFLIQVITGIFSLPKSMDKVKRVNYCTINKEGMSMATSFKWILLY